MKSHVLHSALAYDVTVWLLLGGRERAFRQRLVQLARVDPGEAVLDIGCGSGSLAIAAKQRVGAAGTVHGVDPSSQMIKRAQHKARKAEVDVAFTNGSAESLSFPDAHFDVVLSTMMLHHLPRSLRVPCLREARRVLRPGGRILAVDFGRSGDERRGIITHFHGHRGIPVPDLIGLVRDAGFDLMDSGPTGPRNVNFVLATPARSKSP